MLAFLFLLDCFKYLCYIKIKGEFMARRISIRSIQECLDDNAYGEINTSYPSLTVRDVTLILNQLMESNISDDEEFDIAKASERINLIKDKIIPALQYFNINMAKQKVRQVQNGKATTDSISSQPTRLIGCAYRVLADCYNYMGDITEATQYYEKAERCGIDCAQELRILNSAHPTPKLYAIIDKAKGLKGLTYAEMSQAITEYGYTTVDEILQLAEGFLSTDVVDNLRTALAVYLRNEVGGVKENPPMINLAGGFEKMLKEFFYIPYAKFLDDNENNSDISPTCERLRRQKIARVDKKNISFAKFGNSFTLGNFKYLVIEKIEDGNYQIDQTFYDFITKYYHIDSTKFNQDDFINMARFTEVFRDTIRNPAGHGVGIHRQTFAIVCEELMLKDDSWTKKIVEMTNCKYLSARASKFDVKLFAMELRNFVNVFGQYPRLNSSNKSERLLAKRVHTIRAAARGDIKYLQLTEQDISILREIDFVWEAKINWFDDFYTNLLQYKNEFGNLDISPMYITEDGKHLGKQVTRIRKMYNDKELSLIQTMVLKDIGFEINKTNENTKWFDDFYQELIEYKVVFGSFKGVIYDKILGPEVMSFIGSYQKQKLGKPAYRHITKEMILKLKNIGFELEKSNKIELENEEENEFTL